MSELVAFYQAARARFDGDPAFADRARRRVVLLQASDPETARAVAAARRRVRRALRGALRDARRHAASRRRRRRELSTTTRCPAVVAELERARPGAPSEGAICVFPPGFTGRDGEPVPLMVRKQDGGYSYATTDLAALRYRVGTLGRAAPGLRGRRAAGAAPRHGVRDRPARRLGGRVRTRSSTSPSGRCSGATRRCSRRAPATRCAWPICSTRRSSAPPRVVEAKSPQLDPETRAAHRRARSASARSSTPTSRAIASRTTSSTGTACWRSTATPRRTSCTPTRASARSCAGAGPRSAKPSTGAIRIDDPAERALALALLEFPGDGRADGRDAPARTSSAAALYGVATRS